MLDIKVIREKTDQVKKNFAKRGMDYLIPKVDDIKKLDNHRRALLLMTEGKRSEQKEFSDKVIKLSANKKKEAIAKMREVSKNLKGLETELREVEIEYQEAMLSLPNLLRDDVKAGRDESENEVIKVAGARREFDFTPRDYLSNGSPRDVVFDTTYTLQCYLYGDGSNNKFRFSLREVEGQGYALEVSKWVTIDWYGWKLLEWDLSDPNSVGTWLGNEIMDGKSYYVDSFQLTHDNTGAISGKIYVDNLRVVKKSSEPVSVKEETPPIVSSFRLMQNYPNPFNPTTTIPFDLPKRDKVILKVYDLLGRMIFTLINETLEAGYHEVQFDGSQLVSGIYFYRLEFDGQIKNRQMLLVK